MPDADPDVHLWHTRHGDRFRNVPVLVTGAAGFIGSHLCQTLVTLGARVRGFDDFSGGSESNVAGNVDLVRGSVVDPRQVGDACRGIRIVFHLAALVSVPRSVEDPAAYSRVNGAGTLNVLLAARNAGCDRVIYSASSSAYGDQPTLPKHEKMPPVPMSPYAASKLSGEFDCRAFAACYRLDTVSLRYFNVFGPRQKADSAYAGVIAAFARDLLAGRRPTIFGDGSATRDFTYVANVVHANLLAASRSGRIGGDVYNVGTGLRMSILELADAMSKLAGRAETRPIFDLPRLGDVAHSQADLTAAGEGIGYGPVVDFAEGLSRTWQWYASRA